MIITLGRRLEDGIDVLKEQKNSFHVNAPGKWTLSKERYRSYQLVHAERFHRFVFQNYPGK